MLAKIGLNYISFEWKKYKNILNIYTTLDTKLFDWKYSEVTP